MPRKNHYLPQFYQRRWADAKQRVYVYEKPHDKVIVSTRSTKATGWSPDLYTVPIAPAGQEQALEDRFWCTIDQWGADALAALESTDAGAVDRLDKTRWATFLLSLALRNPEEVAAINRAAEHHFSTGFAEFGERYSDLRHDHEPETFEDFLRQFSERGLSGYGAEILRALSTNKAIVEQLLAMDWQVVTVANAPMPLLTSDRPLIRYRGLRNDDGLLMLPLGPAEFFVAYNRGDIDMQAWITESIEHGRFVEAMNEYVVRHAIRFVYGNEGDRLEFVSANFPAMPLPTGIVPPPGL